jgi:hypothetical protein
MDASGAPDVQIINVHTLYGMVWYVPVYRLTYIYIYIYVYLLPFQKIYTYAVYMKNEKLKFVFICRQTTNGN